MLQNTANYTLSKKHPGIFVVRPGYFCYETRVFHIRIPGYFFQKTRVYF